MEQWVLVGPHQLHRPPGLPVPTSRPRSGRPHPTTHGAGHFNCIDSVDLWAHALPDIWLVPPRETRGSRCLVAESCKTRLDPPPTTHLVHRPRMAELAPLGRAAARPPDRRRLRLPHRQRRRLAAARAPPPRSRCRQRGAAPRAAGGPAARCRCGHGCCRGCGVGCLRHALHQERLLLELRGRGQGTEGAGLPPPGAPPWPLRPCLQQCRQLIRLAGPTCCANCACWRANACAWACSAGLNCRRAGLACRAACICSSCCCVMGTPGPCWGNMLGPWQTKRGLAGPGRTTRRSRSKKPAD